MTERSDSVMNSLPDEILLELLKSMDYLSSARFCSSFTRLDKVCTDYNVQSWFRVKENDKTYLVKESLYDPNRKKLLHSWDDKPAVVDSNGHQEWYKEGLLHRAGDLPAMIYSDGTLEWVKNGELHRDGDLPASIQPDGFKVWCKKDKLHRDNDLPAMIFADGSQEWYKDDERYFPE